MNNINFTNSFMNSEEKPKNNLTNSNKKLNFSSTKISNFKQSNYKAKFFDDDERKNLNELSAKNNFLQNNPKNTSIFNM